MYLLPHWTSKDSLLGQPVYLNMKQMVRLWLRVLQEEKANASLPQQLCCILITALRLKNGVQKKKKKKTREEFENCVQVTGHLCVVEFICQLNVTAGDYSLAGVHHAGVV